MSSCRGAVSVRQRGRPMGRPLLGEAELAGALTSWAPAPSNLTTWCCLCGLLVHLKPAGLLAHADQGVVGVLAAEIDRLAPHDRSVGSLSTLALTVSQRPVAVDVRLRPADDLPAVLLDGDVANGAPEVV